MLWEFPTPACACVDFKGFFALDTATEKTAATLAWITIGPMNVARTCALKSACVAIGLSNGMRRAFIVRASFGRIAGKVCIRGAPAMG